MTRVGSDGYRVDTVVGDSEPNIRIDQRDEGGDRGCIRWVLYRRFHYENKTNKQKTVSLRKFGIPSGIERRD